MKSEERKEVGRRQRGVYRREFEIADHAQEVLGRTDLSREDLLSEYASLARSYKRVLRDANRITRIGDKAQHKVASDRERLRTIRKIKVANGVYWVEVPDADLRVLCGCPADSVKLLIRRGLIVKTEANGVTFETGPNAILLSDVMIQNGQIANLAEFPVLQMLYRQGMLLPNHPNNTGSRPLLIGLDEVLSAQSEYIFRGNYGLVTKDEIKEMITHIAFYSGWPTAVNAGRVALEVFGEDD